MAYQETMRQIIVQEMYEERFNRKHIDTKIRKCIEDSNDMQIKLVQGIAMVQDYMSKTYYKSKDARIAQLQGLDITDLVMDIFVGIAYFQIPELFTSVTAQMSSRLKFNDRRDAITTVAELLAILCDTDAFDVFKETKQGSLKLKSCIPLSDELIHFIENSGYLPPMVCEPLELTHNYSSGYLTHNDSLILGSGNHHDGDICLDVLNIMNKVALSLDTDFLSTVEEDSNNEFTLEWAHDKAAEKGNWISDGKAQQRVDEALKNWNVFKKQSYAMYELLAVDSGNRFYFNHKVDKRGRIYSMGYHINTQGTAFKKAMIEFAEPELVEGVPT